ncbi:MAG: penicillin-binding protein 2 [Deltaproteobacteria bacterium]|nr:penicillin-binding protein 2 [Deltaproteobacteria bacterium]
MIAAGILLLGARLLLVQIVRGERYEQYAAIERVAKVRAQAPRGLLLGKDGDVLARNIESHRLELLGHRVKPERAEPIAKTLRTLLDMTDSEVKGLLTELRAPRDPRRRKPIVVRRDLVSTHCPYDSHRLELVGETPYGFCTTCGRTYEPPPQKPACPVDRRKLVPSGNGDGAHCPSCSREFSAATHCPYDDTPIHHGMHILRCPMCGRTFDDEVAKLRSHQHLLPESRVRTEIQREYPYRYLASHLLGYMSRVNARDLRPFEDGEEPRFAMDDRIGRTGLEKALDALLRGVDGEEVLVRRRGQEERGSDIAELMEAMAPKPTIPGLTARLTLDLALQRDVKVAMSHIHSGAAVALDVQTGAVLALYSKPSFDPNAWSGRLTPERKARVDASPFAPLMNKAVHPFPPASVYKVVASAAALEEGLVTPQTTHHCPGFYEFGGRRFRCHKRSGHGEVNLSQALEQSCDVYFYKVGEQLGIDTLAAYARKMGFGEQTGIEIRESSGMVPTKGWYEEKKGRYFPGFALSTAVGQKDATATPLQVARVYAGIARGGVLPNVSVLDRFEQGGAPITPHGRAPARDMGLRKSTLDAIKLGLVAVVESESGTARKSRVEGLRMAGKTGTAEAAQRAPTDAPADIEHWLKEDHAWFVAYAPVDKPRIVVAVFVEHGGHGGHVAAPIVSRILGRWASRQPPSAGGKP